MKVLPYNYGVYEALHDFITMQTQPIGDHEQALRYHCFELTLSEATCSESIDIAVAYRKVGECHCELGNYKEAIRHHNKYLEIATKLGKWCIFTTSTVHYMKFNFFFCVCAISFSLPPQGNLVEIQRANTTLGRTYFIHGLSELDSGRDGEKLLTRAENTHLASLDVCNRLVGQLRDDEILTMRAGCYLNLGLVYENQSDLRNAHKFMEKALHIAKFGSLYYLHELLFFIMDCWVFRFPSGSWVTPVCPRC